jgi:serine/threonine protein kinase
MEASVQSLCNLLAKGRLLPPAEVRNAYQRWLREAKDTPDDPERFAKWLAANKYVTEFQAGLLLKGHVDNLRLNQYKQVDRLGQGRMAGVYQAVHELGQTVAIKILPPSKAKDPQLFGRFQREARLALRLQHPNVVRTFQVGEANGLNYLVMEYLDGEDLEDVVKRRGKLPPAEAARVVYQALQGLQHLHEQGMVHRDMKPANLMLVPAAQPGKADTTVQATVKILDIGLGRALFDEGDAGAGENFQLTTDGALLGTPDYLAPEQARHAHSADIRSDIYSLGCVLYELLAGQVPFPDKNPVNKMVKHATQTPKPVKELNPTIPDSLQQLVSWMLAKDPAQRPATPAQAAQALAPFMGQGESAARNPALEAQYQAYLAWLQANPGAIAGGPPGAPLAAFAAGQAAAGTPVVADVDLVPVQPPAEAKAEPINRRESMYLAIGVGVGIAGVVAAVVIGLALSRWFRRKPAE